MLELIRYWKDSLIIGLFTGELIGTVMNPPEVLTI